VGESRTVLLKLRSFAAMPEGHAPFAVFNRTANPVVRAVLSSPLHPVLSHSLALITIAGRRSGRRYTFPVGYRQDGDRVLIDVGWPERKQWWRNLRDAGQVEMQIRGKRRTGRALARGNESSGVTVEVQLD
jgi:deazaflavin-dependent oxidoreductase (nitroreductase family)